MEQARRTTIRPATLHDIPFLTEVAVQATRDHGRLAADFDEDEWRAGFADWTAEQVRGEIPDSTTYVIELHGVAVGRLRVVRSPSTVELAGIQLMPALQSQGHGTAIIVDLMGEASASGRSFELDVEKDNPRAKALYERLGLVWASESEYEDHLVWMPPGHDPPLVETTERDSADSATTSDLQ